MRIKTKFALGGGVLLLAAGLPGWQARRARLESEAALGRLQSGWAALETETRRAGERLAAAERAEPGVMRKSETAAAGGGKPATPAPQPRTITDVTANDPKAEVLMLRWQRAVVVVAYGPFFRARGLSPEQIRQFEDIWVRRTERDIDLRAAAQSPASAAWQTVATLQQQSKDEYETAQAQLLGAEGYAQLREFDRTVVVRNVVVLGLAGAASLAGVPLSAAQGEQLWGAALESTGRDGQAGGEALVRMIDWEALEARARQILSPEQFALFQNGSAPSGFASRWKYQLDAALRRAKQAEAVAATVRPGG